MILVQIRLLKKLEILQISALLLRRELLDLMILNM
nr:MAG TPA: hypothetical protein [Bacteriophage sp.]